MVILPKLYLQQILIKRDCLLFVHLKLFGEQVAVLNHAAVEQWLAAHELINVQPPTRMHFKLPLKVAPFVQNISYQLEVNV